MAQLTFNQVETIVINAVNSLVKNTKLIDGINVDLLVKHSIALAYQESKFNADAKNKNSSASGLFQILTNTQKDIETRILKIKNQDRSKIFDPNYSAYLAIAYFAYQVKRYGNDFNKAIIAYNLGSWKNQTSTAYSKTHFKFYAELFNTKKDNSKNDLAVIRSEFR